MRQTKNDQFSEPLLIIGASARAAAESARRGGFECNAIDLFRDLDLQQACRTCVQVQKLEQLPYFASQLRAELFMYTGCMENRPSLIDEMAQETRLAGCGANALAKVRDPFWLSDLAGTQGFRFAECRRNPPELQELPRAWLRKPFRSCGGRQIEFFDPGSPNLDGASAVSEDHHDHFFFQKHVAGIPVSAAFVADATQTKILGISRQLVGKSNLAARPFSYCGSLGPYAGQARLQDQLVGIGQSVAEEAGLIGLFGIDVIVSADAITLIEVNPRYTASMEIIDYARGISCVEHHVRACLGKALPLDDTTAKRFARNSLSLEQARRERFVCKLIQFSHVPLPINVCEEFTAWALSTNVPTFTSRLADIPQPGSEIEFGAPIFSVIGIGESARQAFSRAKRLCDAGYKMVRSTEVPLANESGTSSF